MRSLKSKNEYVFGEPSNQYCWRMKCLRHGFLRIFHCSEYGFYWEKSISQIFVLHVHVTTTRVQSSLLELASSTHGKEIGYNYAIFHIFHTIVWRINVKFYSKLSSMVGWFDWQIAKLYLISFSCDEKRRANDPASLQMRSQGICLGKPGLWT